MSKDSNRRRARPAPIVEVKRHPEGGVNRFECTLLQRQPHVAVVSFEHWRRRSHGGFTIPRGSRSYGFFWTRRPYLLYRMVGPDGGLIADRYDIVEDVRLGADELSYLDLYLDLWIGPDGVAQIEDEDEVLEAIRAGAITREQQRRIGRARDLVLRRHGAIVREATRLLAEIGIEPVS